MSHGGPRPLTGPDDGRINRTRVIEVPCPGHHHTAPGAWMPKAATHVPSEPLVIVMDYPTAIDFSVTADEDLMPWEHQVKAAILGS